MIPLIIGGSAFVAAGLAGTWATFVPQSRMWGANISHGPRTGNRIALTFDDGPLSGSTDAVLDILSQYRVPAAFFAIGRYAAADRSLLARIHGEGHVLGNHTFDHHHLSFMRGPRYWRDQLARTDDAIAAVTGAAPAFFRPPVGFKSAMTLAALRARGQRLITWSIRGLDGVSTPADEIVTRLVEHVRPGDIIALHDGADPHFPRKSHNTVDALPRVIEGLQSRNLQFTRLDDLIGTKPYLMAE